MLPLTLTLNISPCPNDTFMFDALVNGRIGTGGYRFEVDFADIEELNRRVSADGGSGEGSPDICKISYAALPAITDRYTLLDSGSALGSGNGPVFVTRPGAGEIKTVAIPGLRTTANLLLQKLYPTITDRRPMMFSEIAPAVARGDVDAGVLIHEGRFTWHEHGLELVADLGVEWDRATGGLPLPLGAIVARCGLPPKVVRDVEGLIRRSIEYGFAHPAASREFIRAHAREMNDGVIDNHIALFVNDNSLSIGPEALRAIEALTGVTF